MLYLDTAAVLKLVRREPESDTFAERLDAQPEETLVPSVSAEVELPRALRRTEPYLGARVPTVLARIARDEIDETVRGTQRVTSRPSFAPWMPSTSPPRTGSSMRSSPRSSATRRHC
jgi:uncharacterized protein with PIN domain